MKSKHRGKLRRGVLLLHDNAPAHTSAVATSAAAECGYELAITSSTIFARSSTLRLLFVPNAERTLEWHTFFKWQWRYYGRPM